jgi:uncharacterized integral membrane protein
VIAIIYAVFAIINRYAVPFEWNINEFS